MAGRSRAERNARQARALARCLVSRFAAVGSTHAFSPGATGRHVAGVKRRYPERACRVAVQYVARTSRNRTSSASRRSATTPPPNSPLLVALARPTCCPRRPARRGAAHAPVREKSTVPPNGACARACGGCVEQAKKPRGAAGARR
jgi:hypothetical protein